MKKNQENFNETENINDTIYGVHAVVDSLTENLGNKLYIQDDLRGKNVDKILLPSNGGKGNKLKINSEMLR